MAKKTAKGKKSTSKAAKLRAAERAAQLEKQRRNREATGVLFIALAVLLAVYLFFSASGALGEFLSDLLFGLFGFPAYILPVLFAVAGVMTIHGSKINDLTGSGWLFPAAIWDIVTLFHLGRNLPYRGVRFTEYIKAAFNDGRLTQKGGGAVGGVLCFPLQQFGGSVLAYIVLITFLVIAMIMLTRLSLKKMGQSVGHRVQTAAHSAAEYVHERVTVNLPERRLAIFKLVDVGEEEEEFDNPFLPEGKQNPHAELEGFEAAAASIFSNIPDADEREQRSRKRVQESPSPKLLDDSEIRSAPLKRRNDSGRNQNEPDFPEEYPEDGADGREPERDQRTPENRAGDDIWNDLDNELIPAEEPRISSNRYTGGAFTYTSKNRSYEIPAFLPVKENEPKPEPDKEIPDGVPPEETEEPLEAPAEEMNDSGSTPAPRNVRKRRQGKDRETKKDAEAAPEKEKTEDGQAAAEPEINTAPLPVYVPPSIELLYPAQNRYGGAGGDNPEAAAELLVETLANFGIEVKILGYSVGPVITRFEIQPAPGIRVSRIVGLSNDIALALAAERVRIEAPIPGKAAVGIEVPNKKAVSVVLREIVESNEFRKASSPITLAFGKDIAGKVITANLEKMPHLLIAGATGSGKSVCINDLIISMVFKSSPADVRMILIDPKVVELKVYAELPHLLIPVVTEPKKAAGALRWAVNEMMQRYKKFSELGARDLARYNELTKEPSKKIPKLVVIIDELADLMMVAPDDVEDSICRIAQLGRAAGIHLIVATQRPSADIITGLIKANIPSRCAFAVSSGIDSRIILDAMGAEKLLGKGDMLFHPNGAGKPTRVQCAFVSDEEVERVMEHFHTQRQAPSYDQNFVDEVTNAATGGPTGGAFGEGKQEDELLGEAVGIVVENGAASISMIQRRLRVGYARAARLIDMMEQEGYVSGFDGSKPRKVLITKARYNSIFGGGEPAEEAEGAEGDSFEEGEEQEP